MTLSVPDVSARSLGALLALFERTVGFYAALIHVNAYHQPGVEAGKVATYALMGREGYEPQAARLRRSSAGRRAVV